MYLSLGFVRGLQYCWQNGSGKNLNSCAHGTFEPMEMSCAVQVTNLCYTQDLDKGHIYAGVIYIGFV